MKKDNKQLLSKKELENKFELSLIRLKKLNNIEMGIAFGGFLAAIVYFPAISNVSNNIILLLTIPYLAVYSLFSWYAYDKKTKQANKVNDIKNQLNDIISMDFEKKRYELEKKYSDTQNKNDLIKNIQEERELLEKYRNDLNQYCINRNEDEIINEINTRNYTLQKLNQLK